MPVSLFTAKAVMEVSLATIKAPCMDVTACAGAAIENGDPGTDISEPSWFILKPLITGADESPTNKNCAPEPITAGIGVGVGNGVGTGIGVGVPIGVGVEIGVGEIVGVGEGPGNTIESRRGEITHPATAASSSARAMVQEKR
jgi:hypothetical protein